jgi:hypothetical protein
MVYAELGFDPVDRGAVVGPCHYPSVIDQNVEFAGPEERADREGCMANGREGTEIQRDEGHFGGGVESVEEWLQLAEGAAGEEDVCGVAGGQGERCGCSECGGCRPGDENWNVSGFCGTGGRGLRNWFFRRQKRGIDGLLRPRWWNGRIVSFCGFVCEVR